MKNNKFAKITLVILTLALCLGTALAMSISAETTEGPVISSKNIMYSDKYALMYAVPASTVTEGASVTLYIHEAVEPTADTLLTGKAYTVSAVTPADNPATEAVEGVGLDYDAYVFTTDGISAKAFDTQFYAVAQDNSTGKCSEVIRYSVAEYLYERLATTGTNAPDTYQKKMYEGAIAFATGAQVSVTPKLNPETDKDKLIENLRYVVVEGGTIDGYTTGVYAIGTTLNPEVEGAIGAKWAVTTVDAAGKETVTNDNTSYKVIDAVKATLSVGTKIAYREGIDDFNDDTRVNTNYIWGSNLSLNKYTSLVAVEGRGNVVKFDFPASTEYENIWASFNINNTDVAAADATAFEMSFDVKFVLPEDATNKTVRIQAGQGSKNYFSTNITYGSDPAYFCNSAEGSAISKYFDGIDTTDWMHIRMVVFKGDKNCYIYINGEDELFINTKSAYSTYDGTITAFDRFRIVADSAPTDGLSIYVDNVFCGFTKDTKPAN